MNYRAGEICGNDYNLFLRASKVFTNKIKNEYN